ncbi:phosphotransferase [Spirillospora sp. CA-255316]
MPHQATVPVPSTTSELMSPEWLTSALAPRFPGIRITGVTPGPVVNRVSTNVRFHIECEDDLPGGLSPDLCGKGYFSDIGTWDGRRTGIPEVSFYRLLAATSGVRTLRSVYADIDPETGHGVVITEDVVAQGGIFLDALSDYTPEQTAQSLEEFAKLHAATWGDATIAAAEWLTPRLGALLVHRGVKDLRANFESEIGAGVPDEVRDAERLYAAYRALTEQTLTASPWSVIHGDAHVGNLYLDGDGRPSLVDWQLVQRGPWYIDVGYHIASTLTVEDRRRTEKDLLRHYLDSLRANGVEPPSWDDVWLGFRRGVLYGFYLWGVTQKVAPEITGALLRRLGIAATEHESFASVSL